MEDQLKSDFEFVKTLAQEGRDTPLVSGSFYVLWGGLIGAATFLSYARDVNAISLGPLGGVWPWVIAFVAGWIISFRIGSRTKAKPGGSTLGNKIARDVWFAVGVFLTLFWLTLMVAHDNFTAYGVPPYFLFGLMYPISFGLFGVAFYATASASRTPWLRWFALSALGFSMLSLMTITNAHQMLICGVGIIVCAVAPGLLLMRAEPSEIV